MNSKPNNYKFNNGTMKPNHRDDDDKELELSRPALRTIGASNHLPDDQIELLLEKF